MAHDPPTHGTTAEAPSAPPAWRSSAPEGSRPWLALWSLTLGFFMILVDSTIVSVATPALVSGLRADITSVIWVTSAYLLAYAVPLLITGRLGDRYGPKRVYLAGLAVFTLASLACGLTGTAEALIAARVVQGLGASLMTPQTMAVITRLFPPQQRGQAMSLWGATAGVATLVGPILGGVLIDALSWSWIFFVNVPVGVLAFAMVARNVPTLPTHAHTFDWLGVALSAVGLFCVVFGIQEGHTYDWGTITGVLTVPLLIGVGVAILGVFVAWQAKNTREPLLPLALLRDRNFAVANTGIAVVGFVITAMPFPLMIWAQAARGLSPTQAALLSAPSALVTGLLAGPMGKVVNRAHPRYLATFGFVCMAVSLWWMSRLLDMSSPLWHVLFPMAGFGLANAFIWGPLSTAATGNLPPAQAGAGAGIYNTTRQIGAVIGSATISTVMAARISDHLGAASPGARGIPTGALPDVVRSGLAVAMGDSLVVPAVVIGVAVLVTLCFERPRHQVSPGEGAASAPTRDPGEAR